MTVNDLLILLEACDPDAEVQIMCQEAWPFENAIHGVVARADLIDADDEGEGFGDGLEPRDVFIVEGRQERYGDRSAWAVARRH
ncbi:MAG: hypothetical protein Kow0010_10770 [Dehalococcoidia bacterium]